MQPPSRRAPPLLDVQELLVRPFSPAELEVRVDRPHPHGGRAPQLPARPPGSGVSPRHLLRSVWGADYCGGVRTVDVHVRRVRAKLGLRNAARIVTIRGAGYRFER